MANFDANTFSPTLTQAPSALGGGGAMGGSVQQHHGVVGIVIVAVLVLFLLDKAGFRFAVTVGKR